MRDLGLAKKGLLLTLCAALAFPVVKSDWKPLTAEASSQGTGEAGTDDSDTSEDITVRRSTDFLARTTEAPIWTGAVN